MPITVMCHCGKRFDVPDSYAGRKGNCTACNAPLMVPGQNLSASDEQLRRLQPSGEGGLGAPLPDTATRQALPPAPAPLPGGAGAPGGGAPQVTIGRNLGSYALQRKLGDARSGVFLASSPDRGQVALKVLPHSVISASPTAGKRFLREARALFGLQHENVVRCLDAGEELGSYYLAMEYVEGKTLGQLRQEQGGRMSEREVLEYGRQVARGLGYLAQNTLVHRNLKPDHVLVGPAGRVKLVGLGLVRESEGETASLTMKGTIVGTPQYMSPEQARAEDLDVRADLWALGVVMYELLAGQVPFDDKVVPRILHKLATEPLPPLREKNPAVTPATAAVVERLLQKPREERYESAEAFVSDVEAILSGQLVGGLPPGVVSPARKASSPTKAATGAASASGATPDAVKRLTLIAIGLGVLVLGLGVALVLSLAKG